mmetsp:Transcript_46824/g.111400  ORF Transcript_46824/g.111400 Transcript_46824/m.111400 type:complete len:176 (+) Transcript_46824:121-648(+)|eukprot:CAMPEP_0178427656 /NCGR_PEP_ID=MMETSP0689_2-20121128/29859_1 /TAXON_ID=160604 /ORGANISM="Amphidinium massartii, Strain CS-259" /LENGTH=175 /DNA_ID=CAMNT_0020049373 /DNA_START=16 /DNA_END=543 /DNA_ORIENTATION=-
MGVEVETISPGTGKTFPQNGNVLQVAYAGRLAKDGTKFDASKPGQPLSFEIGAGGVIRGWEEGLLKVSLGEKATLKISSDYAYGEEGYGDGSKIPPNADLIFEIELVSIEGKTRKDLEKFEAELKVWAAQKMLAYEKGGDKAAKDKEKYATKEEYAKHLEKQIAKKLRHIDVKPS